MDSLNSKSTLKSTAKETTALRDAKLSTAARAGSSAAFTELQSLYSRHLYNTIFRITRHKEDAEDALQDTFLRAYRAIRNFEGKSGIYTWLTRIGINSALMILRLRRVRPEVSFDLPSDTSDEPLQFAVQDSTPNPEQTFGRQQRSTHALGAILELDPGLRTPILLKFTRDYSVKQIARELKISESAVKSRLYRARQRLSANILGHQQKSRKTIRGTVTDRMRTNLASLQSGL